MRRFEKHLERAIRVAERLAAGSGELDERYKADISSFGTALLHNGLLPAIALFSDSTTESNKRRLRLTNAVYYVLKANEAVPNSISHTDTKLLKEALDTQGTEHRERLRSDIMDAAMAMKLAIRTFHLKKS